MSSRMCEHVRGWTKANFPKYFMETKYNDKNDEKRFQTCINTHTHTHGT